MGIYRNALKKRIDFRRSISHTYSKSDKPSRRHQEILVEIVRQLSNFLLGSACRVLPGPVEIDFGKFTSEISIITYPDIIVICDPNKLSDKGVIGIPDWVIEISYPEIALNTLREKLYLYEDRGVREYWIVDQQNEIVQKYTFFSEKSYGKPVVCGKDEIMKSNSVPGCRIDFSTVF